LDSIPGIGGCLDDSGAPATVMVQNAHVYRGARETRIGAARVSVSTASCQVETLDNAGLHIVVDHSPRTGQTAHERYRFWADRARHDQCALAWINLVGGQDESVYDGGSLIVDDSGRLLAQAPRFATGLCTAALTEATSAQAPDSDETAAET